MDATEVRETKVKINSEKINIKNAKIHSHHADVAVLEISLDDDSFEIVAFGEGIFPSIVLSQDDFYSSKTKNNFINLTLSEFKGFKIWCCESHGDTIRLCLLKRI
jgi:hypothetical protein